MRLALVTIPCSNGFEDTAIDTVAQTEVISVGQLVFIVKLFEAALPMKRIAASVAPGHSKKHKDMEEPEVPIEHLQEEINHRVSHNSERWTLGVALSSALLASFAAVASM